MTNVGCYYEVLPDGRQFLVSCPQCEAGRQHAAQQAERLNGIYQQMDMTPDEQGASLDHFRHDPVLQGLARQLIADRQVAYKDRVYCGLLLIGPTGVGKTYFASAIVNQSYAEGKAALYTSTSSFLQSLRRTFDKDAPATYDAVFQRALTAPLLVLDDFGTQRDTDWAWEQLYILIDHRIGRRMPTIVTSNHTLRELMDRTDDWNVERIISRLRRLFPVKLQGEDQR